MQKDITKLILSALCLIFLFNSVSTNTKIRSINFIQTTQVFEPKYLQQNFPLKKNEFFSVNQLEKAVLSLTLLYKKECYFDVKIMIDTIKINEDSSFSDIFIKIHPGERYTIDNISIIGNTYLTVSDLLKMMQTKSGNCLIQSMLEKDIENILMFYENNGFPWASVKISNLKIDESTKKITIELEIDEKGRARIEEFKIDGNKNTNSHVIIRELRIKPGEIYNQGKIKKVQSLLNRMQIFNSVEPPEVYILSDTGNLTRSSNLMLNMKENYVPAGLWIKLSEGNTNYFDGMIGYLPGGLREKGYFVGSIDLLMRNLFGTARKLGFKWLKDEKLSQEISVRYTEPWLLNYPVNIKTYLFQRKQDTIFIKRYIELKSEFMINENFSAGASISQENVINSSSVLQVSNSGTLLLGLEVTYDTRDNLVIPTDGFFYRSDYYYGNKKQYALSQKTTVQKYGIDLEFYKQILSGQVLMMGFHGKHFISPKIEISDMFKFGGTNTLRGYRENQFTGSRIYWSNLEYRFLLANRSFFYGFVDLGYYYRKIPELEKITEAFKHGYGLGIRVQTGIGIIGLSFALGKGDNLSQTKIHLGLINEF